MCKASNKENKVYIYMSLIYEYKHFETYDQYGQNVIKS